MTRKKVPWEHLSDENLLEVRICDLGLEIEGTEIATRVRNLYAELEYRGFDFRPRCYLADEWLSPNGEPAIGIPFYLAHPRLRALEFRMMFEVEGGTPNWCMKLLRHETGHALDHLHRVHRREDWQRVFGSPRVRYSPYFYAVDPHSTHYVHNLPDNYAQCHPEEDFAETFAVWLNPNSQWRQRYEGWPALRKLRYVNRLMREVAGRSIRRRKRPVLYSESRKMRATLRTYYARKVKLWGLTDLSFTTRDMKSIFRVSRAKDPRNLASRFIRRNKRHLVGSICTWSGQRVGRTARVLANLAKLCDEHCLVLRDDPEVTLIRFSTYVATLVVNHLHTNSYRLRKKWSRSD